MHMCNDTINATIKSILHYDRMIAGEKESIWGDNCALCKRFGCKNDGCRISHERCPIFRQTGYDECLFSPWMDLKEHIDHIRDNMHDRIHPKAGCDECQRLLKKVRNFLEGLLPPKGLIRLKETRKMLSSNRLEGLTKAQAKGAKDK